MELVRRKARVTPFWSDYDTGLVLCSWEFNKFFIVPKEKVFVWMSLHNKPSKNRYEVQIKKPGFCTNIYYKNRYLFSSSVLDKALSQFVGKTLYLQCEYFE